MKAKFYLLIFILVLICNLTYGYDDFKTKHKALPSKRGRALRRKFNSLK